MRTLLSTMGGIALPVLVLIPVAAAGRDTLGAYHGWAAFHDPHPLRCYAISEPQPRKTGGQPYVDVAITPSRGTEPQLHVRLRRAHRPGSPVVLVIGGQRYRMMAKGSDVWAPDARSNAAIVARLRGDGRMRITARAVHGAWFTDAYALRGAATAIDAATIGCAARR